MKKELIFTDIVQKEKITERAKKVNEALNDLYKEYRKFENVAPTTIEELLGVEDPGCFIRRKTAEGLKNKKFEGFPINIEKMMDIIEVEDCCTFEEKRKSLIQMNPIVENYQRCHEHNMHLINNDRIELNQPVLDEFIDQKCCFYLKTPKQQTLYYELARVKEALEKIVAAGVQMSIKAPYVDDQRQSILSKYISFDVNNKSVDFNYSEITRTE